MILSFIMAYAHALIPFEPDWFQNQGKPLHDLDSSIWGFFSPPLVSVGLPTNKEWLHD